MFDILLPGRLTCPQIRVFYGVSAICVSSIYWKRALKGKTDDRSLGVFESGSCRPHKQFGPRVSTEFSCSLCPSARLNLFRSGCGNAGSRTRD